MRRGGEVFLSQVRTLNELYFHGIEAHRGKAAFLRKVQGEYRPVSVEDFAAAGREIALGLAALGLEPGDRVAVLVETRLEWVEADMGILTAGLVSVPIYPTVTASTVEYILEDSGSRVLLASTAEQAAKASAFAARTPGFRVVVIDESERAPDAMSLAELRERGRKLGEEQPELHRRRADAVVADDLATIIYTSGTTGPPKGVMLTHGNIVSNVQAGLQVLDVRASDITLSFLPLSHIFERMVGLYAMWHQGVTIAYAESVETMADNLVEVRPTIVVSVPRLYEKIYARVLDSATQGGPIKKGIFFWARGVGLKRARRMLAGEPVGAWIEFLYRIAYKMVFSKLQARTGGRMRFFVSGGAPLAKQIGEFFYAAGLIIIEGYGLTESSPVLTVNRMDRIGFGTVGEPLPGVEIRIAEDGEILARGPNIMKGYYNQPEATAEALEGGWLHTGDIGRFDEVGRLVITDRKKDLIVTAGGKNVAPQPLENALKTDRFLSEVVILGDRKPYLVALVVPDFANLERYARYKNIPYESRADLVRHPHVRDFIRRRIERRQRRVARYETIKQFDVLDHELTVDAGELTPTLKVKRREIARKYKEQIEAMYQQSAADASPAGGK